MFKSTIIIIAPTIELIQQWRDRLEKVLKIKVGQIGGGEKDTRDITVSTYDSAYLMAEDLGNKFKFLLVDRYTILHLKGSLKLQKCLSFHTGWD